MLRVLGRCTIWAIVATLCVSCASTQSRFVPIGGVQHPPRAADAAVIVLTTGVPARAFSRVARLDVHLEKTGFVVSDLKDAMPDLMRQVRLAGGDAIIEIREQRSSVGETRIYHVTATAVRFVD
jgi:hypothetical protein